MTGGQKCPSSRPEEATHRWPTVHRPSPLHHAAGAEALLIPLKLVRDRPLRHQLYDQLQRLIASARLQPGARMPSTRMIGERTTSERRIETDVRLRAGLRPEHEVPITG